MIQLIAAFALSAGAFDFPKAGAELVDSVERRYWLPSANQYCENIGAGGESAHEAAFTWDKAMYLSAAAAGISVDKKRYQPVFDKILRSMKGYGSEKNGVYGYSVLPIHGTETDRYYDDNEWLVLADLEAYDATGIRRYLDEAAKVFRFVMSGESDALGGGIFWRENERKSKNACSNAPGALAAAMLYGDTKDARYLEIAKRLYGWLSRLRDSDGLLMDHIGLGGKIERTKWSYNSALAIQAGIELFRATGDSGYLEDAKKTAKSSREHWVDPHTGAIKDDASFANHLADAFLALAPLDPAGKWDEIARRAVEYAYLNTGKNGHFGARWDRLAARASGYLLLWQGSMARGLLSVARFDRHEASVLRLCP